MGPISGKYELLRLDSLVAIETTEPYREYASYAEGGPVSSSRSSGPAGKENERRESGELRALSTEPGEAIEGVLAAPNEKLGDGRGPGMGDGTERWEMA